MSVYSAERTTFKKVEERKRLNCACFRCCYDYFSIHIAVVGNLCVLRLNYNNLVFFSYVFYIVDKVADTLRSTIFVQILIVFIFFFIFKTKVGIIRSLFFICVSFGIPDCITAYSNNTF